MYALSTLVMAHQEYVNSFYVSKSPVMVKEGELDYSRSFSTNLTRDAIAQQILNDLSMDGAYSVSGGRNGGPLVIQRQHAMPQRRLTFDASKSKITIEREEFRTPTVLERLHRRRGYNQPYRVIPARGIIPPQPHLAASRDFRCVKDGGTARWEVNQRSAG